MIRRLLVAAVVSACVVWSGPAPAASKGGGSRASGHASARGSSSAKGRASSTPAHVKASTKKDGTRAPAVARTTNGRIARSAAAKHAFEAQTGYPHGRPGYVVDHITPLACGGLDAPSNMQWQTIAAARAKDKIERVGCR
jgi:hypothetical protein